MAGNGANGVPLPSGLNPDEATLLRSFLQGASAKDRSVLSTLSGPAKNALMEILQCVRDEIAVPLDWMWELDYREMPVDVQTFLETDYYFGKHYEHIWPGWLPELQYVLDPGNNVFEWIISGGIGAGKSFIATVAHIYKLYRLSLLHSPQTFYELDPSSLICIGLFNITLDKTELALHQKFISMMQDIPYFRERFPYKTHHTKYGDDTQIILPRDIRLISGSGAAHAMSLDIYGAILDEQNYREGAKRVPYKDSNAYKLYRHVRNRIHSRFGKKAPCLLVNVSSAETDTDFMVEHSQKVKDDKRVHMTTMAKWDCKPDDYKDQKRFYVLAGGAYASSRIIQELEEVPPNAVAVPEEFKEDFEADIDRALRDIAGEPVTAELRLIPVPELVDKAALLGKKLGLRHPFKVKDVALGLQSDFTLESLLDPGVLFEWVGRGKRLKRHPDAMRSLHVDLAVSGDSAGIACTHVSDTVSVTRLDLDNNKHVSYFLPVVEVDFMLGIRPTPGGHIDFTKILQLIVYARDILGMRFMRVSYDGFQSEHSLQILQKNGFNTKLVSVDRKPDAYMMLRQCMIDGRLVSYEYEPFREEIVYLIWDGIRKKVDHVYGRKKDISDALAGSIEGCLGKEGTEAPALQQIPPEALLSRFIRPAVNTPTSSAWVYGDYRDVGGSGKSKKARILEISGKPSS